MKKRIISSILKRVQDGSIPKDVGVSLCFELRDLGNEPAASGEAAEVAVIGLAGRYPQAGNLDELWDLLKAGRDAVSEIPADRWDWRAYYHADPEQAGPLGKSYCKWGGFLAGYDEFDPFFFHLSPREAGYMDLQERLFLEVAWETLEDAGYTRDYFAKKRIDGLNPRVGVFVGATWQEGQLFSDAHQQQTGPIFSTHAYHIANRVSYLCGFEGPSLSIDTACSSSLTALHLAWESIVRGTADLALAGGVSLSIHPNKFLVLSGAGFASKTGRCQSFGNGADGYVPGEGVGALLLKPKAKAIADGDHIYGIIKASAINHGGKTNGYTVPSPSAQSAVVSEALRRAQVAPRTVSYIEAHGTGTALGDPIEIAGLEKAFGGGADRQFCAIGSIKSNLGHCEAAAGIAGVTKVLLQMAHRQLAPSLHTEVLNPRIDFAHSPFRVQRQLGEWKRPLIAVNGEPREHARIAGVSSFGAGGANAHVVIEEAPAAAPRELSFEPGSPFAVVLSARNKERLAAMTERLLAYVTKTTDRSLTHMADIAYTLQVGRDAMEERLAFVATSMDEAQDKLRRALSAADGGEGLFRGRIQREGGAPGELGSTTSPDMAPGTQGLEALLGRWVQGGRVNWETLHENESLRRIRLPTYPFARERYPLSLVVGEKAGPTAAASSAAPNTAVDPAWDGLSYLPVWVEKPNAPATARPAPIPRKVLIVHAHAVAALADGLERYYRVRHPSTQLTRHEIGRDLRLDDPEGAQRHLGDPRQIEGVFFLAATGLQTAGRKDDKADPSCEDELLLLRLARACGQESSVDLYVVTADTFRTDDPHPPRGGGLSGLAYAIAQSHHHFRVRNLHLAAGDPDGPGWSDALAAQVVAEPPSDRACPVRLSGGIRYEQAFAKWHWGDVKAETGLRQGGVYVIIGGSGAVGGVVTRHLLRHYQAKVVWIGRRDGASAEIQARLAAQETCGDRPGYIQADATDPAAIKRALATIKQQANAVHGVIFAGVEAFGGDDSAAGVQEPDFQRRVEVKTIGAWHVLEAFRDEPLDFFCLFSSIQAFSFLSSRGSASYAAAITAGDAVAEAASGRVPFPVGRIHWSYWKVSVAGTPLEQSIRDHFGALDDQEACQFLERYTALLRKGAVRPMICLRASASVHRLMAGVEDRSVTVMAEASRPVIPALAMNRQAAAVPAAALSSQNEWAAIEEWLAKLLLVQIRRMGAFLQPGEARTAEASRTEARIVEKYRRWWETCAIPALESRNWLIRTGDTLALSSAAVLDADEVWTSWDQRMVAWELHADLKGGVMLVDNCLRQLPAILRGETPATGILFPESSMASVGEVYQGNSIADLCNATLAQSLADYVHARIGADAQTKLRLIEIGAGTGATTAVVLPRLEPYRAHIERYDYTDLSKAFLLHAEDHFRPRFGFVRTARCNIERPPGGQDFASGSYDVVIASNVLHATANIGRTLRHAKSLLKRHGLLVLNEATQKTLLGCLTFGLLDGWWLFEDEAWRIPGAPLLDLPRWRRALAREGFQNVFAPLEANASIGQHVLLAASDGVVECGVRQPPVEEDPKATVPVPRDPASRQRVRDDGDLSRRVAAVILSHMTETLRTTADKIDPAVPFSDYGLDSILGVGFVASLNQELGLSLNAAVIFDHSSVDRLTRHLLKACAKELAILAPPPEAGAEAGAGVEESPAPLRTPESSAVAPQTAPEASRIAVIGISGQFPGAGNVGEFWENLLSGRDGVGELPPAYLGGERGGKSLYKWGGVLADRDCFDSLFFNISPREAEAMHPHQRLVLQECWKGLEDAGLNPKDLEGARVGVYVGAEPTGHVMASFTGSSEALIASRLSYFLNLKGPALVVNTGCSSSASAIHLACESLRHQESDVALACGVYAGMNQPGLSVLADIGMLSPHGQCLTFDAAADGTVLSEGIGVVVLKRLDQALADGDPIHGIIAGSGMNQDGASNGITAPNGEAQEALIIDVYRRFKIDPERIGYLEAHGTGTRLGDPVEANALVRAFRAFTPKQNFCAVGSAKAHIGHASAAAGVIGLIRILLSMRARRIPGLLHFRSLNPLIEFGKSAFHINRETIAWPERDGQPLMAAMNAFGHSGTNVHLVVEEQVTTGVDRVRREGPYLAVLSARNPERLVDAARQLLEFSKGRSDDELADVCYTLQVGREAMNERLGLVAASWDDLRAKLDAFLTGEPRVETLIRGSARTHREALASFLMDEDADHTIDAWFAKHKYGKLLDVWVKGFPVKWNTLYPGDKPRRIHYPTYPFAKDRYPAPPIAGAPAAGSAPAAIEPRAHRQDAGRAVPMAVAPAPRIAGPTPFPDDGWDGLTFVPCWEPRVAKAATPNTPRTVLLAYQPSFCGFERSLADDCRRRFPSVNLIQCDLSRDPGELAAAWDALPPIDACYFLSIPRAIPSECHLEDIAIGLEQHEMALLRLLKVLMRQSAKTASIACYLLTTDNYRVGSQDTIPVGGGVTGLAYSLAQADHRFQVRNLDLSREDLECADRHASLIERIHAEEASARGQVVKLRGHSRWVRSFRRWDWGPWRTRSGILREGVYVILGGSGVVGGIITRSLMEQHDARVVWLGRRSPNDADVQSRLRACTHGGRSPDYIEADATQPESLALAVARVKQTHGKIHGAIFAGLIFEPNHRIDTTTEDDFAQIVNLKAKGGFNFYDALKAEDLDFLCFFSSVQAFPFLPARESCGYATGITFADSLAAFLGRDARFPVGVINWGYWERSVAGTAFEGRLVEHFNFISDQAGVEFFERFTHLLRKRVLSQMVCLGASERIQALMGCRAEEIMSAQDGSAGAIPTGCFEDYPRRAEAIAGLVRDNPLPALEPWMIRLLEAQLWRMNAVADDGTLKSAGEMRAAGSLTENHARWWEECRGMVEAYPAGSGDPAYKLPSRDYGQGLDGKTGRRIASVNPDEVWEEWEREKPAFLADPDLEGAVELLEQCLRNLPRVLKGEVPATDILFPKSSLLQVGSLHRGNALADHLNGIVADALARYVRHRLQADPGATLRVLEVGAGTGGTTALVLPALRDLGGNLAEYGYTDLSKAFLVHGERQFAADYPFLTFSLWDVETPPPEAWLGRYDVVIATNVLHATRDIRQTLQNLKGALKRHGLLVLNEGVEKSLLGTLTFGLLDGWWRFNDPDLRLPGAPLLTSAMWQSVLRDEGFSQVVFPAAGTRKLGHQVILAESDGIFRRPAAIRGESRTEVPSPAKPALPAPVAVTPKTDVREKVTTVIGQALAESLNLPVAKIGRDCSFAEYGVDSILGVSFIDLVNARLGVNLGTAIIFDYSTVDQLTDHVLRTFPEAVAPPDAGAASEPATPMTMPTEEATKPAATPPASEPVPTRSAAVVSDSGVSPIAVIGMSGQFPGAENPERFWKNLVEGVDGISVLPDRYAKEELFKRTGGQDGYRWGGVLEGRDHFDPLFFRIAPREAESMSPHQRLVLQEGWKSLEDAGYNPRGLQNQRVGVYVGAEPAGYFHESFTGSSDAIVASRLSYHLNFRGPALAVNTGCSSSAVALHLACESLRKHETDMALAGGVCATVGPSGLNVLSDAGMLSPTGQCHSLDASANGTVLSEGVGMVVLKRLADALADGDPIHGVIQASGMNQDGASNGITAPNGIAQEALIAEVCRRFAINPEHIDYVETHGTATRLGDPVEVNALVRAFKQFTSKTHFCALGSAKAHIGHTSAASGVIGLIKVLLSLKHRAIPKLLHFETINPLCKIESSAFFVNPARLDLGGNGGRARMAAINSFGHSGTNVHLVVREHLEGPSPAPALRPAGPRLVVLSAKSRERLDVVVKNLSAFLEHAPGINLSELAYTLQVGREAMSERAAWLVEDVAALADKLRAFSADATSNAGCWRGHVDEEAPAIRLLAADDDTRALIAKWLAAGKFEKLAEFWTQGIDLDWNLLYPAKPRRISLPAYPFVRDSYWVPAATAPLTPAIAGSAQLHPLVHENRSSFSRQRFSSRFTGLEFFFNDHQVRGVKVLPGVAYLEMARAAVAQALALESEPGVAGPRIPSGLRHVVWLRPLRLETPELEVHVELVKSNTGSIDFEIHTQQGAEAKVVYCQGSAVFEVGAAPASLPLAEIRERTRQHHYTPDECYGRFRELGIAYGAGHKGLEALYAGEGQLLARVSLPAAIAETKDQYFLHPALLDAALQGFIGFMLDSADDSPGAMPKPSLPFALEQLDMLAPCPSPMWAWIRSSAGSAPGDKVAKFDLDLGDDQGRVCARLRGFSTRVLEGDLAPAAEKPAATRLLTQSPVWNTVPSARVGPIEPTPGARLVVIGGTDEEMQPLRELYPSATFLAPDRDRLKPQFEAAGRMDHLLWIAPEDTVESLSDERMVTAQADGVYQVFGIVKTLLALGFGDRDLAWTFVTRQTHAVMPGDVAHPLHASVHGLVGSLAKEYPHWKIRLLDMDCGADWSWPAMLQMPFHPAGDAWFHRHGEWFERALIPVRDLPAETPLYRRDGVYVVIGGAGGIGEAWTRFMIEKYHAKVYWIGRRALDEGIQERLDQFAQLDPPPEYLRANAAERTALESARAQIKRRHGVINGVVHSAIVLLDKSLANMDEARFRAGLEAKGRDVSVRAAQVFGGESLDFLLFFSSLQSFSKGPGQSNYAAGCTFKDAYAQALGREHRCVVKVMNWGFWGSLGIVKDASYHQRMAQGGMGSLEPDESLRALETFMSGSLDQVAVSKILDTAPSGEPQIEAEWLTVHPRSASPLSRSFLELKSPSATEEFLPRVEELEPADMEETLLGLLWVGLDALGVFKGENFDRSKVRAGHQAWLEQSLALLAAKGWLARPGGGQVPPRPAPDATALWEAWERAKPGWISDARVAPQWTLLGTCLRALPDILAGKRKATDVLFPASSTRLVEGVYQGNPVADFFNEQLADAVVAYVKARAERPGAPRLRILEVGAGTGGTSAGLLAKLKHFASSLAEYCYTDISKTFLFHAENHFVPSYPFVTTRLFDVSKPLEAQDVPLDAFDVCVATNVLHATENIRLTLRNVKASLHQGGVLLINEICGNSLFAHLTFGLLDGWWLYKDAALRIPGCPGLSPETWERVLRGGLRGRRLSRGATA